MKIVPNGFITTQQLTYSKKTSDSSFFLKIRRSASFKSGSKINKRFRLRDQFQSILPKLFQQTLAFLLSAN